MDENKYGRRKILLANLESQIWADGQRKSVNRKPQFLRSIKLVVVPKLYR